MITDIDLFKYLACNPATLHLTDQEYYSCYSRQVLREDPLTTRDTRFRQITILRYLSTIKHANQSGVKKLFGEGVLCSAGQWCNRDFTADLISGNGKGLCHSCFQSLYSILKSTGDYPLCSFCKIERGFEVCRDCSNVLSRL